LVVQIITEKIGAKKQNGGQNQDGRQAWIFHSSVNFYANQFKFGKFGFKSFKKMEQKNKMADKIKMAGKLEFSLAQSIFMQINWNLGFRMNVL
jgi:hypothetical protein